MKANVQALPSAIAGIFHCGRYAYFTVDGTASFYTRRQLRLLNSAAVVTTVTLELGTVAAVLQPGHSGDSENGDVSRNKQLGRRSY